MSDSGQSSLFFLLLSILASILAIIPLWVPVVLLCCAGLVNTKLMTFFYQRKGFMFTLGCLCYQQFYYIYSSTAFVYAMLEKKITEVMIMFFYRLVYTE